MSPKQGTIILTPFPFTDLSGNKVRPAIVVSKRHPGNDVVLAFISSLKTKKLYEYDVRIKQSEQNGLKVDSVIKCEKLATLEKKVILGEIGKLSNDDVKKVLAKIQALFGC